MATWADIQRLAADLQRVQLSKGIERLSDANCVEIISKLIQSKAIDVIFTVDGKEYITRKHLLTQIKFECDGAGGRIPIVDVAANLRIDLSAAKEGIEQLLKENDDYLVSQDELIASNYIYELCKQLDEMLFEEGHLSIFSLTQKWNVPIEFLKQYVLPELGKHIRGQRDGDSLYTSEFIDTQCNKLLAAFYATNLSCSLNVFYNYMNIEQGLFFNLLKTLINENKINGTIVGPKTSLNSLFVPYIQEKMTNDLIKGTILNERAITVNTLKKLNANDYKTTLNTIFNNDKDVKLIYLPSVVILEDLFSDLRQNIEDNIKKLSYCNVDSVFGEYLFFETTDIQQIIKKIIKENTNLNLLYNEGEYIFTNDIIKKVFESLSKYIKEKATVESPNIIQALKEANTSKKVSTNDDDDWNGKGNKKKGGKKGGKKTEKEASQTINPELFTISKDDIFSKIEELDIIPSDLIDEIIDDIMSLVNQQFKSEVENFFTTGSSGKDQKQSIQEKIKDVKHIYTSFCIYEESAIIFNEALKEDLHQYLLKSIGQEFATCVLSMFVDIPNNQQLTPKIRKECISSISDKNIQNELNILFESLTKIEKFHDAALSLDACNVMLKKPNKSDKEEFNRLFTERQKKLLDELDDRAQLLLTIVIMILFYKVKMPLHASGKFVSPIVKQLVDVCANAMNPISADVSDNILQAITLVVKVIKGSAEDDEKGQLDTILNDLKEYLKSY